MTTSEEQIIVEPDAVPLEDGPSQGDPDKLGDAGKRALDAERRARREAEKRAAAVQARLDEYEAEKLSKEEKAAKDAADAYERAAKAEQEAGLWRVAAQYGISDEEDLDLLGKVSDDDARVKLAERLAAARKPAKGNHIPTIGNQPEVPVSLAEQIAVAEQSGDHALAMQLKTQQLAELARTQR